MPTALQIANKFRQVMIFNAWMGPMDAEMFAQIWARGEVGPMPICAGCLPGFLRAHPGIFTEVEDARFLPVITEEYTLIHQLCLDMHRLPYLHMHG